MPLPTDKSTITLPGNGSSTTFDFDFVAWESVSSPGTYHLSLWHTDASDVVTEITSNYSIALNADQDANPGGTVTYPVSGTALTSSESITINRNMPFTQEVDLQQGQAFNPEVVETSLNKIVAELQQLKEELERAATVDPGQSVGDYLSDCEVAQEAAEAAQLASETAKTSSEAALTTFQGVWLGVLASEPAATGTDGAMYFNTTTNKLRVEETSAWQDAVPTSNLTTSVFSGDAATVNFTLPYAPTSADNLIVAISGVLQAPTSDYTVSGTTITFTTAPHSGTDNVVVRIASTVGISTATTVTGAAQPNITSVGTLTGLTVSADSTINSLTVGKGANSVLTNVAMGVNALDHGSLAQGNNVGVGYNALTDATTGSGGNVAIGAYAADTSSSPAYCIGIGYKALSNGATTANIGIGQYALQNTTGTGNISVGNNSGKNATGSNNVAIGSDSLDAGAVNGNVAVGNGALGSATSSNNTGVGLTAGSQITTGQSNIAIGSGAQVNSPTTSYQLSIGNYIYGYGQSGFECLGVGLVPDPNTMQGIALEGGVVTIKATITPTADANYGKIYCKADNKLYFQDGAGVEHAIAFG